MKRIGLLGAHCAHSCSPKIHNSFYQSQSLPWSYELFDIEDRADARAFLEARDFCALNVTTPYKGLALSCAATASDAAHVAQGANVLVNSPSGIRAYNFDGRGFVYALEHLGCMPKDKHACVCGTGPTASAITHALLEAGARVTVLSRSREKAHALTERLRQARLGTPECLTYEEADLVVKDAQIVINATPLGMQHGDPSPIDTHLFCSDQWICDVVYGCGMTAFRQGAQEIGARNFDGSTMLAAQAMYTIFCIAQALDAPLGCSEHEVFSYLKNAL